MLGNRVDFGVLPSTRTVSSAIRPSLNVSACRRVRTIGESTSCSDCGDTLAGALN